MKDIETKWKENIDLAKYHLNNRHLNQMLIAELAMENI